MTGSSQLNESNEASGTVSPVSPPIVDSVRIFPYEMAISLYKGLLAETKNKIMLGELTVNQFRQKNIRRYQPLRKIFTTT